MLKRADSALSVGSSHPSETPRSGFSSFGTRVPSISSRDAALYSLAQGLVPVINDPSVQSQLSPAWCWPFGGNSDSFTTPPPLSNGLVYEVTLQDFRRYMRVMADKYTKFEANLASIAQDEQKYTAADPGQGDLLPSQGDGLAQSMRQVPTQYFTEEFSLSRPETWREVCPSDTEEDRQEAMDQLSGYLDVVETHLLRDIAARSENFFQAASVVQDLRGVLARTYTQVKTLRQEVHLLDTEVLEAAVLVQKLQCRRNNLKSLQHKLQVVEHVKQSQEALSLLLPQGDYAGALDIMTDIQNTAQREGVHHMHCFRHLPQQLQEAGQAVQQLMSSDLLSLVRFQALGALQDPLLAAIMQNQEILASGQLKGRSQYRLQSEDGSAPPLDPQASAGVAPLMNGSLDPLTHLLSVGRAAIDSMQPDSAEADEMAQLVTPLVLGLRRTGGLPAVLRSYREAMALEVKQAIRDIVEQTLPVLLASQWPSLQHHSLADKLQAVSAEGFQWLLACVLCVSQACLQQCRRVRALLEEGLRAGRTPRTQWAPVLQDMQEAGQAVSEVAHDRWAKLLASRAAANKEMQMGELKQVLQLCDEFARMAASFGCRAVPALQAAVQLQCKAYLEHLHHHTLTNLTGALEQESWAAVPVPHDSQQLVDDWAQRAQHLKAASPSKPLPTANNKTLVAETELPPGLGTRESTGQAQADTSQQTPASPTSHKQSPRKHDEAVLRLGGHRLHVAHTALLLLRMLQAYMTFQETVPSLVAETARRAVDLLKAFNSRMCQLVLGAGAMQVSGLRSITAKHLALSSQCLSAYMALQPLLKPLLTPTLPAPHLALLLPEFDRLLQDLSMHKEEIHSKLVAIMRERLATNLKQLPLIASSWTANSPPNPSQLPPSNFAQSSAKQLRILSQVLSPILLPSDLHSIFGRVAALFSKNLAEAFTRLEPQGMFWEAQCGADLRHMLHTLEQLPMDPAQASANIAPLSLLCDTRFAALSTLSAQPSKDATPRQLHRSLTESHAHTHKPRSPLASPKRLDAVLESVKAPADGVQLSTQQEGATVPLNGVHNGHPPAEGISLEPQLGPAASANSALPDMQSASLTAETTDREHGVASQQQQDAAQSQSSDQQSNLLDTSVPSTDPQPVPKTAQQAAEALDKAADQVISTDQNGELDMVATSVEVPAASEIAAPALLTPVPHPTDHDRIETTDSVDEAA